MDRTANSRTLPLHWDQIVSDTGRMPPKITPVVLNIAISKTYIDLENPDSCVVTASEKYIVSTSSKIVQRRSMPTCALYSFQERRFGFHVRLLVDKNWPGLFKV